MFLVNNMELKFDKEKNFQERLWFLHHYSNWVKSVPNKVWSRQQADFINSLFLNGKNYSLSLEDYLNMVNAGKDVRNKRLDSRKVF